MRGRKSQSLGTEVYSCNKEKFQRYCMEFEPFALHIRQRATLRRALWRKIELEFEEALAYEFEQADIINPDEDEADCLDPLHDLDYNDWKHGQWQEDEYSQQIRHEAITQAETTQNRLNDPKFNPMQHQHRIQLGQNKYTSISSFQQYIMNCGRRHLNDNEIFNSVVFVHIPNIRLQVI